MKATAVQLILFYTLLTIATSVIGYIAFRSMKAIGRVLGTLIGAAIGIGISILLFYLVGKKAMGNSSIY